MWSLKEMRNTTVYMIRHRWLRYSLILLLFVAPGIHTLLADHRHDYLAHASTAYLTYLGLMPILIGLGVIAFAWYLLHMERMSGQLPPDGNILRKLKRLLRH